MFNDAAIKVENVSKSFKLPHEKQGSVKGMVLNIFRLNRTFEKQKVLKDISFEIRKGEFFGIVGRNGSGKSTLLKLLAGIYSPDRGEIHVNGRLTPFIELGVGFNPELTGRENVFLNGALLGFNRKEMRAKYQEIVDFAEIEKFMDQKLKNYSSGMQVRLAFSIAIRARGDILLLDEVLAVGDSAFQQKCYEYFELLKQKKKTVIIVTHDMGAVKRFCTRGLLLEKGKIKVLGTPEDIANQYLLDNISNVEKSEANKNKNLSKEVKSLGVKLISSKNYKSDGILSFEATYSLNQDLEIDLGYSIVSNGFSVAEQNTKSLVLPATKTKMHTVLCEVPLSNFNPGVYTLDIAIFTKPGFKQIGYEVGVFQFIVDGTDKLRGGPMMVHGDWIIKNGKD